MLLVFPLCLRSRDEEWYGEDTERFIAVRCCLWLCLVLLPRPSLDIVRRSACRAAPAYAEDDDEVKTEPEAKEGSDCSSSMLSRLPPRAQTIAIVPNASAYGNPVREPFHDRGFFRRREGSVKSVRPDALLDENELPRSKYDVDGCRRAWALLNCVVGVANGEFCAVVEGRGDEEEIEGCRLASDVPEKKCRNACADVGVEIDAEDTFENADASNVGLPESPSSSSSSSPATFTSSPAARVSLAPGARTDTSASDPASRIALSSEASLLAALLGGDRGGEKCLLELDAIPYRSCAGERGEKRGRNFGALRDMDSASANRSSTSSCPSSSSELKPSWYKLRPGYSSMDPTRRGWGTRLDTRASPTPSA